MMATTVLCSLIGTSTGNWHWEETYLPAVCEMNLPPGLNADFVAFSWVYFACLIILLEATVKCWLNGLCTYGIWEGFYYLKLARVFLWGVLSAWTTGLVCDCFCSCVEEHDAYSPEQGWESAQVCWGKSRLCLCKCQTEIWHLNSYQCRVWYRQTSSDCPDV